MASYRDRLPVVGSGGAVIKSVQRGSVTIGSSFTSASVTVPTIDPMKSVLMMSFTTTGASNDFISSICSCRISSPTELTFYRKSAPVQQLLIEWQVIEYDSGVSVQRGTLSGTGVSFAASLSPVDITKSYVVAYNSPAGSTAAFIIKSQVNSRIASASSLAFTRDTDSGVIDIDWQVVSYV